MWAGEGNGRNRIMRCALPDHHCVRRGVSWRGGRFGAGAAVRSLSPCRFTFMVLKQVSTPFRAAGFRVASSHPAHGTTTPGPVNRRSDLHSRAGQVRNQKSGLEGRGANPFVSNRPRRAWRGCRLPRRGAAFACSVLEARERDGEREEAVPSHVHLGLRWRRTRERGRRPAPAPPRLSS
jgi:hypothetical protein